MPSVESALPVSVVNTTAAVEAVDVRRLFVTERPDGSLQVIPAVDSVSFRIEQGEFVSFVGPSGCGKTTTMRLVGGLDRPTSGEIRVLGEITRRGQPTTSLVFQDFNLMPWRTVRRNVALGLELMGRDLDTVDHYLELVGLAEYADLYPHQLSGGMKQRAGLARALCLETPVLLMDEPFAALDALTRETLQRELLDILRRSNLGQTIIFVTHSVDEAIFLSDRIFVFAGPPGHIAAIHRVDIPRPRDMSRLRELPEFAEMRRTVLADLGVA